MTDFRPTNEKIAELLQQQTYDERMEMAEWFRNVLIDIIGDLADGESIEADTIASLLSNWVEAEMENAEDQPS